MDPVDLHKQGRLRVQALSVAIAAKSLSSIRKPSCQPIALAAAAPKR
ncbi:hypothetical protein MBRA_00556 [Methylobacterium brachiatum]|nr:hypothetical protein MBRA_00556 [Methylobacterium brachiatum]